MSNKSTHSSKPGSARIQMVNANKPAPIICFARIKGENNEKLDSLHINTTTKNKSFL